MFEVPASLFAAVDSASLDDPTQIPEAFFERSGATAYFGEGSGQVYMDGNRYMRASDSTRVQIVSLHLPVIRGDLALVEWGKSYDNFLSYDAGFISLRRGPDGWEVIARGITFST